MIDFNYINSLPELSAQRSISGGDFKVSAATSINSASLGGVDSPVNIYVLQGATLTLDKVSINGDGSTLYLLGSLYVENQVCLPKNSRLILGDFGMVVGSGTLVGENTQLDAPIKNIFCNNVKVTGTWNIPQAYAAWFSDPKTGYTEEAINSAIEMKKSGEVILEAVTYTISSPVVVLAGIQLNGVSAIGILDSNDNYADQTVIQIATGYNSEYMVNLNATDESGVWTWVTDHVDSGTVISNIIFDGGGSTTQRCIIAAGAFELSNLLFVRLLQAVKFTSNYSDNRKIIGCSYKHSDDENDNNTDSYHNSNEPIFDLYGAGDDLLIDQLKIDGCQYTGLRVGHNAGTTVRNCVLNCPVEINEAKAISFFSNHMECSQGNRGTYLKIIASTASISSCYFEKGQQASIDIYSSTDQNTIVNISNCIFAFIDGIRYSDEKNLSTSELLDSISERVEHTNMYDVKLNSDEHITLNLSNNYRYDIPGIDAFERHITLGIWISINGQPFSDFNKKSSMLSQRSEIAANKVLTDPPALSTLNADAGYSGIDSHIYWLYAPYNSANDEITYTYQYRYLTYSEIVTDATDTYSFVGEIGENGVATRAYGDKGIYFSVLASNVGWKARLLIKRSYTYLKKVPTTSNPNATQSTTVSEYVILPISNGRVMHDNGISIAGFKWTDDLTTLNNN